MNFIDKAESVIDLGGAVKMALAILAVLASGALGTAIYAAVKHF